MKTIARAFPVKSKEDIKQFANEIDRDWSEAQKALFFEQFGINGSEHWFYQQIEGKDYVVSTVCVEDPERGFAFLQSSDDPFAAWFRQRVLEITGVSLAERARGPEVEALYAFQANPQG
ncbi:MAG: hypothetical protein AAF513_13955 [Pseudomonadota bacterium]